MTLFERIIARAERYVESIDRERDHLALVSTWDVTTAVERAFIPARLAHLEQERIQAVALLEDLQSKRYRPELMFESRPKHRRMLSLPLRSTAARKEIA